jgi:hypothetical protein
VSFQPLQPRQLLGALTDCGVEFTVIGATAPARRTLGARRSAPAPMAMAVNVWSSEIRGTGDLDIMVPKGDAANRKALDEALRQLEADRLNLEAGGIDQADAEYPTLMFQTRFGKLDILYRPDGSAPYRHIKARAARRQVAGCTVQVAGRDDMVRMKTACGRERDLADVASMTESEKGDRLQVKLTMKLADGIDAETTTDVVFARVEMFDDDADVWIEDRRWLKVRARRAGMSAEHIRQWAGFLAERLQGMEILRDAEIDVEVTEPG